MNVSIVDYQSGNISSVINSFTEVAKGKVNLKVTSDFKRIKTVFDWQEYPDDFKEKHYGYIDEEFRRREEGF